MQAQNLLLDGVLRDEVVDGDVLPLTDTVGPVGSLLLNGGIPPRVKVYHIVGTREVEPQSASLQTDEEHRATPMLEVLHQLVALAHGYRAIYIEVGLFLLVEHLAHKGKERRELAEDKHGITTTYNLLQQVAQGCQFRAVASPVLLHQLGGTRSLAQAGNLGQRIDTNARCRTLILKQLLGTATDNLIDGQFIGGQCDGDVDLGLVGQFFDDLLLGAAQHKGTYDALQLSGAFLIVLQFDGYDVLLGELFVAAQQARIGKLEQIP